MKQRDLERQDFEQRQKKRAPDLGEYQSNLISFFEYAKKVMEED